MVDEIDKKLRALGRATEDLRPTDQLSGAVVDGVREGDPLQVLASATDGLMPSDAFSDSVMARIASLGDVADAELATQGSTESADALLQRAADATSELRPGDGFTDAVLAAIAEEPAHSRLPASRVVGFYDGVTRSARSGLLFAAAAAAACVLLSWYTQRDFDTQLMLQADVAALGEEGE